MSRTQKKTESNSPTANMLADILRDHAGRYTLAEIADGIGIGSANAITQIKMGRTMLPIKYIKPLGTFLKIDHKPLLLQAMTEYYPDMLEAMADLKGETFAPEEEALLRVYRNERARKNEEMINDAAETFKQAKIASGEIVTQRDIKTVKRIHAKLTDDPRKLHQLARKISTYIEQA